MRLFLLLCVGLFGCAEAGQSVASDANPAESPRSDGGGAIPGARLDSGTEFPFDASMPDASLVDAALPDAPVQDPPDAAVVIPTCTDQSVELLDNGSFDTLPTTMWVETSGSPLNYSLIDNRAELAHSGGSFVWLGGYLADLGLTAVDRIEQTITLPGDAEGLSLSGARLLVTDELLGVMDTVDIEIVDVNGTLLEVLSTWSNVDEVSSWQNFDVEAGEYAGQTIKLRITARVNDALNTNFFFDSLSLTTTRCL